MNEENKLELLTFSNQNMDDFKHNSIGKIHNNSYLINNTQSKPEIVKNFKNNYLDINNELNIDDSNIITETSKINLIKNPPNLLNLSSNVKNDEFIKIYNENVKLSSELTLEKSKVIKLTSLLKEKEKENLYLKQKMKDLDNNYEELEKAHKKYFEDKIKSIYKGASLDKTNIKATYEEIQRFKDKELSRINDDLNHFYDIITLFFNFLNKKINFLIKTGIIPKTKSNNISLKNNYNTNYNNSLFIINSFEDLIKNLLNDNKTLYNELICCKKIIEKNESMNKKDFRKNKINYIKRYSPQNDNENDYNENNYFYKNFQTEISGINNNFNE